MVRHIFWCNTSVHIIFGSSYFLVKHICSYYIWFVIFFGAAPLFILYLVRLIFWCSTSVHTIFGSSYFWVQHMCSYYIWFVIFWNVLHLRVLLLDLRVLALFVLLWRVILWYVILLRVLLLHWRVIPVVHGTHGASYISVLNLGMPTSMVLFKWDGSIFLIMHHIWQYLRNTSCCPRFLCQE